MMCGKGLLGCRFDPGSLTETWRDSGGSIPLKGPLGGQGPLEAHRRERGQHAWLKTRDVVRGGNHGRRCTAQRLDGAHPSQGANLTAA